MLRSRIDMEIIHRIKMHTENHIVILVKSKLMLIIDIGCFKYIHRA